MSYYQQGPYAPPPRGPEAEYADYEYEEDDYYYYDDDSGGNALSRWLFMGGGGGCLLLLCFGCCVLLLAGLWVWDPGSGLVETPVPGSDIGQNFDQPAYPDEAVINDEQVQLKILEVNRNVALPGVAPVEGREMVVITIELINLSEAEAGYSESDFILINPAEEAYTVSPASASVDGALGRGRLRPQEGIEGRLVFDLLAGEANLILGWEGGRDVAPRFITME